MGTYTAYRSDVKVKCNKLIVLAKTPTAAASVVVYVVISD